MSIDVNALLSTLPTGLYGMGGIFIVMTVVYLCIRLMTRAFSNR